MQLPFDPRDLFGDECGEQIVLLCPAAPVHLSLTPVPHEMAPEGTTVYEARVADARLSRFGITDESAEDVLGRLDGPVRILIAATEYDPGIQVRLVAMVPAERAREVAIRKEPWRASTPSFEGEGQPYPEPIGNVVRLQSRRKHPNDLGEEARDILLTLVARGGDEVSDHILGDLGLNFGEDT